MTSNINSFLTCTDVEGSHEQMKISLWIESLLKVCGPIKWY
jgi:hypothetical protein